jgi:hypothetical protein
VAEKATLARARKAFTGEELSGMKRRIDAAYAWQHKTVPRLYGIEEKIGKPWRTVAAFVDWDEARRLMQDLKDFYTARQYRLIKYKRVALTALKASRKVRR